MDSIRVSEAPDTGSIPVEATRSKNFIAKKIERIITEPKKLSVRYRCYFSKKQEQGNITDLFLDHCFLADDVFDSCLYVS